MYQRQLDRIEKELFGKYEKETRCILDRMIYDLEILIKKRKNDADLLLFCNLCKLRLKQKRKLQHISEILENNCLQAEKT